MGTDFYNKSMFYGANTDTFRAAGILRRNMTLAEHVLWKKLRNRKIFSVKFRKQHPIKFYIADFYCHSLKLVIEVDGGVHNNVQTIEHDDARSGELEKLGNKVIRFTNDQVIYDIDSVIKEINKGITEQTPL